MNKTTKILSTITAVLAAMLLTSAVSHAEVAPKTKLVQVPVQKLNYQADSMMVSVSGILPNLCTAAPRPILKETSDKNVLQLAVDGLMVGDVCVDVAMIGNSYELAFDIRSLKFNLADMHIDTEGTYKIISEAGQVIAEVDFSKIAFDLPFASHQVTNGKLAVLNDGRLVVADEATNTYEVRSSINLNKYIGRPVDISGFVVNAHSNEFGFGAHKASKSLFLVTGLNTTTH